MVSATARVVCFGEVLLRLNAPNRQKLLQSPQLETHFGGAEANVAVALAHLGSKAQLVSTLPDNALGEAAAGELRRYCVDVSELKHVPGRMGLYFVASGAVQRRTDVLYDRSGSAFALAAPESYDWQRLLAGAGWLHVSGVTPAVSAQAGAAALRAVAAAKTLGVKVSFDCNYRERLWSVRAEDPRPILDKFLSSADLLFADHRDIAMVTGQDVGNGDAVAKRDRAMAIAFARYPNLWRVAGTFRTVTSTDDNTLAGCSYARDGQWHSASWPLTPIVDRIGGGDAFAAGFLHAICAGHPDQYAIDFATAVSCLKHSMPGDFALCSAEEAASFLGDVRDVAR